MPTLPSPSTSTSHPTSPLLIATGFAAAALLGFAGCASAPVPTAQMAVAEAAVQHANTSSTSDFAPTELQIAVSKLASARQAMTDKDYPRAQRLAAQVEVDAQVAELRAQAARSRKSAAESQDAARVLREELERRTAR